jgi:hypothetical protein
MQDILEQFPTKDTSVEQIYRSFIYQPERVSVSSRPTTNQGIVSFTPGQQWQRQNYSQFTTELRSPLLKIKSLELLRATIPNAITNIPNTQAIFVYYRIPTLGAPDYAPDYSELDLTNMYMVRLLSQFAYSPDQFDDPEEYGWNRTFEDYQDLVNELNKAANADPDEVALTAAFYIPGDIQFQLNPITNKISFTGLNAESGGVPQYYYLPVGFNDPNLPLFINLLYDQVRASLAPVPAEEAFPVNFPYTLNRRLGFLWNGLFDLGAAADLTDEVFEILLQQTTPSPPIAPPTPSGRILKTAEGYIDLVNTANVFLYADIVGGSTQDADSGDRLLAVIPIDTANLGVAFPESKVICPLTKVSDAVYQIRFSMRTDTGEPFWLPVNAYVNLELKLTYN